MKQHLFVYGTLMKDYEVEAARFMRAHSEFLGKAFLSGALYDLGSYPALVLSGEPDSKVQGEVFVIRNPVRVFNRLDQYEGREYQRKKCICHLNEGPINSWVYEYIGEIKGLPLIHDGVYRQSKPKEFL